MLPGVTRALVIELAQERGVHVRERAVSIRQLIQADEAFLTSSVVEILPVVGVDEARIGSGNAGPQTRMLGAAFRELQRSRAAGSS
jgi:branched-subunit amino acid aminotransferase/4-amino-4-deoxychorismate lyase